MKASLSAAASEHDILGIISRHTDKPGAVLGILEEAQEKNPFKYLPPETLKLISEKTGTPLSRIYSIATFYSFFNLQPQGEHTRIPEPAGGAVLPPGPPGFRRKRRALLHHR